jgi:pilus assembly protein CpaE
MAAKGGVGVSTMALNLAITYQRKQRVKVIAAELRAGQGSWGEELDITDPSGLVNLLRMRREEIVPQVVEKQLVSTNFGVRLLLASESSHDVEFCAALPQFEASVNQLAQLADLVLLDIGTSFHPALNTLIKLCDEIILVTEPQPLSVRRTRMLIEELRKKGFGNSRALTVVSINRTRTDMTVPVRQIEEMLKTHVAMVFPPAAELAYHSTMRASPMCLMQPDGILAMQFVTLSDQIAQRVSVHARRAPAPGSRPVRS